MFVMAFGRRLVSHIIQPPLETSVEDQHSRNDSMDIENHAFLKKLSVKGAIFHSYRYVKPGG